jgi:hypothetical protein
VKPQVMNRLDVCHLSTTFATRDGLVHAVALSAP